MSKALVDASAWASVIVPEDGIDLRNAASVETPFQTLTDRTKWLAEQANTLEWNYPIVGDSLLNFDTFSTTSYTKPTSGGYVDVPSVAVGDVVIATLALQITNENTVANGIVRAYLIEDHGGTPTETPSDTAKAIIEPSTGRALSHCLQLRHVATKAGTLRIGIEGKLVALDGTNYLRLRGTQSIIASHQRQP